MSSGRDWTHHWLLSNMGPSMDNEATENEIEQVAAGCSYSGDGILTSPVASIDLERDSPMACGINEDEDIGPPSIETQPPDNLDVEVAGITSSWISSADHFGSSHSDLRYSVLQSDIANAPTGDSSEVATLPELEGKEFNAEMTPVYGPSLPVGPYTSPVQETSPLNYGDIIDKSATGGVCGLRNLGNTCFMAAGLQCLINTPPIAQYFFNHNIENQEAKQSLVVCFSQLIHKIWSGKYSSLKPSEFKEAFGTHWRDFRDYRQHDCQEFMTLLLEALRKQMPLLDEGPITAESSLTDGAEEKFIGLKSYTSSVSSTSSSHIEESKGSISSSPLQSPRYSPLTLSPGSSKKHSESRNDMQDDYAGLDSGPASPKSSISSSSVDAHLTSLRQRPIPEEIKSGYKTLKMTTPSDGLSIAGTIRTHDEEASTSNIEEPMEGMYENNEGEARRYNTLNTFDCETSADATSPTVSTSHCLSDAICDINSRHEQRTPSESVSSHYRKSSHLSSVPEKNQISKASVDGTVHLSMVKLEDIMKETKTSNINVLAKDNISNNEFLFNSEKYTKVKRLKNNIDGFNKYGLKRIKEVNLFVNKMDNSLVNSTVVTKNAVAKPGRNSILALNKRIRLEEKNVQYEMEKNQTEIPEGFTSSSALLFDHNKEATGTSLSSEECKMAEESWTNFVGESKSAVVDTFYGQFRSSLVCSSCGHTSIKFDPFGTLSVPLPHANEIQIPVTYVPFDGATPTRYLVTLFKVSNVQELKAALLKLVGPTDKTVVVAEVFDNHIARIVEDSYLTKFLNMTMRNIYAYELITAPFPASSSTQYSSQSPPSKSAVEKDNSVASGNSDMILDCDAQWQSCNICLEELCQTDLKSHPNCDDCVLCDSCIEMSCKHHGGTFLPCPVCHTHLSPSDLIPVLSTKTEKPKARILRVAVVFRLDTDSNDNNKREMQLVGHPCLISLPSRVSTKILMQIIHMKLKTDIVFSLLLVDGRGYNCSRCLFSSHCRGCEAISSSPYVILQAGDTLCVRFKNISTEQREELGQLQEHPSMSALRPNEPLTLYDCLRAFTQSETLEDSESWYCPKCECKQLATKTISVWKFPPYLIIHLERFLFHGATSTKVDEKVLFPTDGLDLSDFVTGERHSPLLYNLYSCVCHMGVAQAGHYTALVRSPMTREWHNFNDDCVTRQKPGDEEYSTSYLLFYHREGTKFDLCIPKHLCFTSPKIDYDDAEKDATECCVNPNSVFEEAGHPSVSSVAAHSISPSDELESEDVHMQHKESSVVPDAKEPDL